MKKKRICVFAAFLAAALMSALTPAASTDNAFANLKENLDMSKKGSITLAIADPSSGTGYPGINLELIQVASVVQNEDGNYVYQYTENFTDPAVTLSLTDLSETDMGAREKAETLMAYANTKGLRGTTQVTNANGQVSYGNLDLGVYLIRNYPVSENMEMIRPFLVTVPRLLNNEYVYDVNATGKPEAPDIGGDKPEDPTEKNKNKNKNKNNNNGSNLSGNATNNPSGSSGNAITGSRLPQTGQLWWPVPILAGAGIILIVIGIMRRRRSDDTEH